MADKKITHKTKKNPDGSQTYSRGKTTREKSKGSDNRMVAAGKRSTAALDVYLNKKGRALTPAQKKAAWKKYTTESGVSTGISKNAADNYRRLTKELKLGELPKRKTPAKALTQKELKLGELPKRKTPAKALTPTQKARHMYEMKPKTKK